MIRLLRELPDASRAGASSHDVDALNLDIAARLRTAADHLQAHDPHPYRAASFRLAADAIAAQPCSLRAIYEERGPAGLDALPGVGPGIAAVIDGMLRSGEEAPSARRGRTVGPPVQLLIEADREYRASSTARLAGRDLHLRRDGWNLRIFFSHSARAQELGRTHDWVIVIAGRGDEGTTRHTIVTETRGKLAGRRVVRGREAACRAWYSRTGATASTRM